MSDADQSENREHDEIESDRRWDELFARTAELLEKLAAKALAEYETGPTERLDPDNF
jgi:hypothetical protein